jgi:hypothetical protein
MKEKSTNTIFVFFIVEKTAEKLRYLRISTSTRKSRSKRSSQVPSSPNHLQSPVTSEARTSTSSTSNATGNEKIKIIYFYSREECCLPQGCYLMTNNEHDDEDFEEEPIKLWS